MTQTVVGPREIVLAANAGDTDPEVTALDGGNWAMTFVNPAGDIVLQIFDPLGVLAQPSSSLGPGLHIPPLLPQQTAASPLS